MNVAQLAIHPGFDQYDVVRAPVSFQVERSNDGIAFEVVKTFSSVTYTPSTFKTFAL